MAEPDTQPSRRVLHPRLGPGSLLKTYMSGFEFEAESASPWQARSLAAAPVARALVLETDQFRARQTLEALRLGIVPVQDVETLTIGMEAEQVTLDRALARIQERGGDALAVIGDYGFGKSHFVELAARRALRENCLVASASLDLVEVPPGKANEIYKALLQNLRYPDSDARGLGPLLRQAQARPEIVAQLAARSPREKDDPFVAALNALVECPSQLAHDELVLWLSAQLRTPTAEMRSCLKRPPRLYLTGEVARQYCYLLTAISVLATLLGYGGLAVLIDESEHYSLLRATQRGRADAFFKAMIYAALGQANSRVDPKSIPYHAAAEYELAVASSSNLFFLFALTESENRMPVDSWLAPSQILRLDDRFIERDIRAFFTTLLRYHAIAYGYGSPPPRERYEEPVRAIPGMLARALSQHRINVRELIRLAVTSCDLLFLYPDYDPATLIEELGKGLKL